MNEYQSLNHTKWDCKFHVVWTPKYRKKVLYGQIRKQLGQVLRELAPQKESEIVEGRLVADRTGNSFPSALFFIRDIVHTCSIRLINGEQ